MKSLYADPTNSMKFLPWCDGENRGLTVMTRPPIEKSLHLLESAHLQRGNLNNTIHPPQCVYRKNNAPQKIRSRMRSFSLLLVFAPRGREDPPCRGKPSLLLSPSPFPAKHSCQLQAQISLPRKAQLPAADALPHKALLLLQTPFPTKHCCCCQLQKVFATEILCLTDAVFRTTLLLTIAGGQTDFA